MESPSAPPSLYPQLAPNTTPLPSTPFTNQLQISTQPTPRVHTPPQGFIPLTILFDRLIEAYSQIDTLLSTLDKVHSTPLSNSQDKQQKENLKNSLLLYKSHLHKALSHSEWRNWPINNLATTYFQKILFSPTHTFRFDSIIFTIAFLTNSQITTSLCSILICTLELLRSSINQFQNTTDTTTATLRQSEIFNNINDPLNFVHDYMQKFLDLNLQTLQEELNHSLAIINFNDTDLPPFHSTYKDFLTTISKDLQKIEIKFPQIIESLDPNNPDFTNFKAYLETTQPNHPTNWNPFLTFLWSAFYFLSWLDFIGAFYIIFTHFNSSNN